MAIDQSLVGRILAGCSNQSAPGEDRMGAEVVKLLWQWDPERITNLARLCIQVGVHPECWKTAKGIVIPKPGKPDYRQVRAHRVIALLDSLGKLVERQRPTSSPTNWNAKGASMMANTGVDADALALMRSLS